jgi:fructose-1,6-bisphosphatase/inositol monophosphatase family enzyme
MIGAAWHASCQLRKQTLLSQRISPIKKGTYDYVTFHDVKAQNTIVQHLEKPLKKIFPGLGFYLEEESQHGSLDGWQIVVDPIDGTLNFKNNLNYYAVSIALCFNGKPEIAVVTAPASPEIETFWAIKGAGSYRIAGKCEDVYKDSRPIKLDPTFEFGTGYLAMTEPRDNVPDAANAADNEKIRRGREILDSLHQAGGELGRIGAKAMPGSLALTLCLVANDCFIGAGSTIDHKLWDVVAGGLILQQAGGVVKSLYGNRFHEARPKAKIIEQGAFVAGSPEVVDKLVEILRPTSEILLRHALPTDDEYRAPEGNVIALRNHLRSI